MPERCELDWKSFQVEPFDVFSFLALRFLPSESTPASIYIGSFQSYDYCDINLLKGYYEEFDFQRSIPSVHLGGWCI